MKIDSIGCGYRHDEEFEMNCPSGIGCWLLLLVKTPAAFYIGEREYRTESNSFVLLSPKIPVKYSGNGGCYEDDWLFFGGWSPYEDYFSQMGIPINTVIESKNLDEASGIMRIMSYEHYSNDKFTEKNGRSLYGNTVHEAGANCIGNTPALTKPFRKRQRKPNQTSHRALQLSRTGKIHR